MTYKRGDIFLANLDPTVGREINKTRPIVVVSNDINNEHAGTVTVVPITSQRLTKLYPFEVLITDSIEGLEKSSKAKADQIRTLDKSRLGRHLGKVDKDTLKRLNEAIRIHLAL